MIIDRIARPHGLHSGDDRRVDAGEGDNPAGGKAGNGRMPPHTRSEADAADFRLTTGG